MSSQQTNINSGLPDYLKSVNGSLTGVTNPDGRLCSSAFVMSDLEVTGLSIGFVLSNEDIYLTYKISPFNKPSYGGPGPDYNSFIDIVPLAKRNVDDPLNDYVKLSIGYNYEQNYIRLSINDIEVYRLNRIGYPTERKYCVSNFNTPGQPQPPSRLIRPTSLTIVAGNFSTIYMYNAQNPGNVSNAGLVDLTLGGVFPMSNPNVTNVDGTNKPATFLAQYNQEGMNGTNFGQGNNVSYKYFSVYLSAKKEKVSVLKGLHCCKEKTVLSVCEQDKINGVNASSSVSKYTCKGCVENCDPCLLGNKCECYVSSNAHPV